MENQNKSILIHETRERKSKYHPPPKKKQQQNKTNKLVNQKFF